MPSTLQALRYLQVTHFQFLKLYLETTDSVMYNESSNLRPLEPNQKSVEVRPQSHTEDSGTFILFMVKIGFASAVAIEGYLKWET